MNAKLNDVRGTHRYITYYTNPRRKDGRPGRRFVDLYLAEYTPLRLCEQCGRLGTPKRIQYRGHLFMWFSEDYSGDEKYPGNTLCMACWNRWWALIQKHQALQVLRRQLKEFDFERKAYFREAREAA